MALNGPEMISPGRARSVSSRSAGERISFHGLIGPSPRRDIIARALGCRFIGSASISIMPEIFVSYRRADSADATGRICDRLRARFGETHVFTDAHSIGVGADFPAVIESAIAQADFVVVVIGPGWIDARDRAGKRRLDDAGDFVRLEVEAALSQEKRIIPLYVGGAAPPDGDELPESLRELADINGIPVRPDPDFANDIDRLIRAIAPPPPPPPQPEREEAGPQTQSAAPRRRSRVGLLAAVGALAVAGGGAGLYAAGVFDTGPGPETGAAAAANRLLRDSVPYDPNFLGRIYVQLPQVTDQLSAGDILDGRVFNYIHYSLVMDERRAMPLFTAANIDRSKRVMVRRGDPRAPVGDVWYLDPRIPAELQRGNAVYQNNDWDRGHLVPRTAVTWGDSALAQKASLAAFFYSNAAPQDKEFNRGRWSYLEEYVLSRLHPDARRLSVFCGPVSRPDDREYRGSRIPRSFWKVVAVEDPANPRHLFVYAWLMDQYAIDSTGVLHPMPRLPRSGFDPRSFQVSVGDIEALTPLRFGVLKDFDTYVRR